MEDYANIKAIDNSEPDEDIQLAENAEIDNGAPTDKDSYAQKRLLLEKTRIVKQSWSILEIIQKLIDGRLILNPDYQRNEVWNLDKKTAFIESLFMGIIIPPIYVVEVTSDDILEENRYEVVDGKQRLLTIQKFIKNEFALQQRYLEYYADWFGGEKFESVRKTHPELTSEMLSSVLDIYVITANSPEFTKYDIFSRLNKGSAPLRVNEIRKAIYRSDVLVAIDLYVNSHINREPYNSIFTANDIKHYDDYGRFYRSVAFYLRTDISNKTFSGYNSRPREMINGVLEALQKKEITVNKADVERIIDSTIQLMIVYGENPDREYLVDACIYFAMQYDDRLREKYTEIMKDEAIRATFDKSPSTTSNVNARLKRVYEIVMSD